MVRKSSALILHNNLTDYDMPHLYLFSLVRFLLLTFSIYMTISPSQSPRFIISNIQVISNHHHSSWFILTIPILETWGFLCLNFLRFKYVPIRRYSLCKEMFSYIQCTTFPTSENAAPCISQTSRIQNLQAHSSFNLVRYIDTSNVSFHLHFPNIELSHHLSLYIALSMHKYDWYS